MVDMFYRCSNLTSLDVSNFNTELVTDMSVMFSGCSNLTSLDVSKFDTSSVTYGYDMFLSCDNLKGKVKVTQGKWTLTGYDDYVVFSE